MRININNNAIKRVKSVKVIDKTAIPDEDKIGALASILAKQFDKEKPKNNYATAKLVLSIIGATSLFAVNIIAPGTIKIWKIIQDEKERKLREELKKFNNCYLKRTLFSLEKQKLVKIIECQNGEKLIKITSNGQKRLLKYSIDNIKIDKQKNWDKKWRVVIWDIPCSSNYLRLLFRKTLKKLGFLQIQKSVFVYPYPCFNQVTFLKEYYAIGAEVIYMVAEKIENDSAYMQYFGL